MTTARLHGFTCSSKQTFVMSTSSQEPTADPVRLAAVGLLVELVAETASRSTTWRNLGALLHERYQANGGSNASRGSLACRDEPRIPLRFTLREGWTSQQLRERIADACALGALHTERGGILRLGPAADAYLECSSSGEDVTTLFEAKSWRPALRVADQSGADAH
jgi:hypothetical protein